MSIQVRAMPRAVKAMDANDEAQALETKFNDALEGTFNLAGVEGRLVQVLPAIAQADWLLAIYATD
jgi:hypothetical protein